MAIAEQQIWDKLKECQDPELPCNIVDLGLVYGIHQQPLDAQRCRVDVTMTLTTRFCPMAAQIAARVQAKLREIPGVAEANVTLVYDPPWNPSRMRPEVRQRLGLA